MNTAVLAPPALRRPGVGAVDVAALYSREGVLDLDRRFLDALKQADAALAQGLAQARRHPDGLDARQEAALIIDLAPHLEAFIARTFGVVDEAQRLGDAQRDLSPLFFVKRHFVQRRAFVKIKPAQAEGLDGAVLEARLLSWFREHEPACEPTFDETTYARHVQAWMQDAATHAEPLQAALEYAAWALHTEPGRQRHRHGVLFKMPTRFDPSHLLVHGQVETADKHTRYRIKPGHEHWRDGFELTDPGMSTLAALDQSHYCVRCHDTGTDSCSKGLREKPQADAPKRVVFKKNSFGHAQAGCPLEEKISEFHELRTRGCLIGALAVITIDNPTAAATGHRICNDCMKACIYQKQKQQPVDIPQAESRTLKDVLALPWGFEIYSLLTRWNPLNLRRPVPKPPTGHKVMVVGLGPAGITLAHHLMNEGHSVVAIDRLPIEPLPASLAGTLVDGRRTGFEAVRDVQVLRPSAEDRRASGFGGTAETGIVGSRWDKNNLTLLRLLLERRSEFALVGGVEIGTDLGMAQALELGFDHIALCAGAPQALEPDLPNAHARGVHRALDFLRMLQLEGAAQRQSRHTLRVRLPIVVIGGGLTAIDAATESLAYYAVQVERLLQRHEAGLMGEPVPSDTDDAVFFAHALALREERRAAEQEGRPPHLNALMQGWGGVTLAYRRGLIDSPAYTLNHEEVEKALEEGIFFAEGLSPRAIDVDERGAVHAVRFERQQRDANGAEASADSVTLKAGTLILAIGSSPDPQLRNSVLATVGGVTLTGKYFNACNAQGQPVETQTGCAKPTEPPVLLARLDNTRFASFYGDLHPAYAGNVVRAIGSAKQGYPLVSRVMSAHPPRTQEPAARLADTLLRLRAGKATLPT